MTPARLLRLLPVALIGCLLMAPGAHAGLPGDFVGVVSEDTFAGKASYRAEQLTAQRRVGVGLVRQTFDWAQIEREPLMYDFSAYDAYVGQLAEQRLSVLPILFNPPSFQSSKPSRKAKPGTYPPASYSDLGDFAAVVVRRYGPRGTFWTEHPELPFRPVHSWQVWNEPTLPSYWPRGPNPRSYTKLLKATSAAIKRVDPQAEVVTAGIPNSNKGTPLKRFLEGMYKAGAKGRFDTLAVNAQAESTKAVMHIASLARKIMDRHGDRRAKIWITEIGWASGGPKSKFTLTKQRQAGRLKDVYKALGKARSHLKLRGIVYFAWKDGRPYAGRSDFWGLHTGLLDRTGHAKPALSAFRKAVRRLR